MRRFVLLICLLWGCVKPSGDKLSLTGKPFAPASQPASAQVKVTAEWVEYFHGKKPINPYSGANGVFWELTTSSIVVTREVNGEKTYLLIDTGISPKEKEDRQKLKYGKGRIFASFGAKGKDQESTAEALKPYLSSVSYVIPSHLHGDHLGGIVDLALPESAQLLLSQEEVQFANEHAQDQNLHISRSALEALAKSNLMILAEEDFKKSVGKYEGFDDYIDLFGDQSIVLVKIAGHTPGSVGIFINTTDGKRILYVGDTINSIGALQANAEKGAVMRRTDCQSLYKDLKKKGCDVQASVEVLGAKKIDFDKEKPPVQILPAHDRKSWVAVFQKPSNR